jgi:hypothetical protein
VDAFERNCTRVGIERDNAVRLTQRYRA